MMKSDMSSSGFVRRILPLLLLLILGLTGCQFAYYNVFYNARKNFDDAMKMAPGSNGKASSQAIRKFRTAEEKCEIILAEYPDSKWVDDAIFMLGQCNFYKGNTYQALERFSQLIQTQPDSEFVPDALLLIAECFRNQNNTHEAYKVLREFLADPNYTEKHPVALLKIANYYAQQKEYRQTEFYLRKLIREYPDAEEFEPAFLLLANTYHNEKDFLHSNTIIDSLLDSGVTRRGKLEARFLQAKNGLALEQFEMAEETASDLIDDEYVLELIPRVQLIQARALVGMGNIEDGITQFLKIIEDNKRTDTSAEAAYYLAETYFVYLQDHENAIKYFNEVKKEKSNSPHVPKAMARSAIASQIVQFKDPNRKITTKALVEEQFKLAEYYVFELELPDSAFVVYDTIENQYRQTGVQRDSASTAIEVYKAKLDSLGIKPVFDRLIARRDSLQLFLDTYDPWTGDSIPEPEYVRIHTEFDSLMAASETYAAELRKIAPKIPVDTLKTRIAKWDMDMLAYRAQFLPHADYNRLFIHLTVLSDTLKAREIHAKMQTDYPDNPFTHAAGQLLRGEQPSLTSPLYAGIETKLDAAMDLYGKNPRVCLDSLKTIHATEFPDLARKVRFNIGFVTYFALGDSNSARNFFDSLLTEDRNSEYSQFINKFYDGRKFTVSNHLKILDTLDEKAKKKEDGASEVKDEKPRQSDPAKEKPPVAPPRDEKSNREPDPAPPMPGLPEPGKGTGG